MNAQSPPEGYQVEEVAPLYQEWPILQEIYEEKVGSISAALFRHQDHSMIEVLNRVGAIVFEKAFFEIPISNKTDVISILQTIFLAAIYWNI